MKTIGNIKLYTLRDIANRLQVAYTTALHWKQARIIPYIKIGNRNYFTEETYNNIFDIIKGGSK